MAKWLSAATFLWLVVYAPLETYVSLDLAGLAGLTNLGYVMNVAGMALMFIGAVGTWRAQPRGAVWLVVGWAWTTATFWRATSDRFWWHSLGNQLYAGDRELWLAPAISALATLLLIASVILLLRQIEQSVDRK